MQPEGDLDKWKTKWESGEHLGTGGQKRTLKLRLKILMQKNTQSIKRLSGMIRMWSEQYALSNKKSKHINLWKVKANLFVGRTSGTPLPSALK